MLECAVSGCGAQEKFLRSGTLHLLDIPRDDKTVVKRMVWLCDSCSRKYMVQTWRKPGEQICQRRPGPMFIVEDHGPAASTALALRPNASTKPAEAVAS